jgi:hypothetical protein
MTCMTSTWRAAADALVSDLRGIFAGRLRSVVAYGPRISGIEEDALRCLALVETLSAGDLDACAKATDGWQRHGLATPLILTAAEFRQSLDSFPLEFGEIIRAHERVIGDDPFEGLTVASEDARRACEHQVRGHLIHLREGYMESLGRPESVAALVAASTPAFTALLRTVARLAGVHRRSPAEAAFEGARVAGVSEGLVRDLLTLEGPSPFPRADAARLFPEYLASVEQLTRTVDTWRA